MGFGGFGGVVAEFVDEGLEVGALGHLIFVFAFGGFAALFFCGIEGGEVGAFVVVEALGVLVDYVCRYFVEEGAVVGDYEEGGGVGLEVGGEEGYGGDVEHVGGFCCGPLVVVVDGDGGGVWEGEKGWEQYHRVRVGLARRIVLLRGRGASSILRRRS